MESVEYRITVAARCIAHANFSRSATGIAGSNTAGNMNFCPPFLCCVVLCK